VSKVRCFIGTPKRVAERRESIMVKTRRRELAQDEGKERAAEPSID
jgi:hypothetical protein